VLGLSGTQDVKVPAGTIPAKFLVKGKYVEFTVVASTFGIEGYTFTGAPNALDMTGGRRTVVFASKTPDHRGLALTDFSTSLHLILEGLRSSSDADLASLVHLNSLFLHEVPNGE